MKTAIIPTCLPDKESNHFAKVWFDVQEENKYNLREWAISKEVEKAIHDYHQNRENALTLAIQSCGYQYDEVLQYLKNNQRFILRKLEFGYIGDKRTEYVLYDSYQRRAFLLAIETDKYFDISDKDNMSVGFKNMIQSYSNREVPYNYQK